MQKITVEKDKVTINNLVLEDPDIARALGKTPEAEREDFLRNAIRTGIFARDATTDEFEAGKLASRIERIVSETTTSADTARKQLTETVDVLLKSAQDAVRNMIDSAGQKASSLREQEAAKSLTAQAGREFEQAVGEKLREIATTYQVEIDHVGESPGKEGKKGDYVIKFEEGDVVFETKKAKAAADGKQKRYSKKYIMNELRPAVTNRDAGYGVFITQDVASLPKDILGLGTVGGGPYMACGLEEGGRPLPKILPIVCQMARARMAAQKARPAGPNPAKIEALCREALASLNEARKQCKSIRDTANSMEASAINRIESLLGAVLKAI